MSETPPTIKIINEIQHSIGEHMSNGYAMNQSKPAPNQDFFDGFMQGLTVSLSIAEAHKKNERGKLMRLAMRNENKNVIPYESK